MSWEEDWRPSFEDEPRDPYGVNGLASVGTLHGLVRVDLNSEMPIYVQVKNQLRLLIEGGVISAGRQLPTVRELAVELNINANTVSRVYTDLAREGYTVQRKGVGTFAAARAEGEAAERPGAGLLAETLRQLQALGLSKRQILELTAELLSLQQD
ncbi:GntR family transcriptional regulator [bacterium]|nr:GntR family transcriptional regulator [bacterium]